jgi:signal transduction histidine kinase
MQLDTLFDRIDAADERVTVKLRRATQSSERLAALIESLLDVSRFAPGHFTLEVGDVDLRELVSRVIEDIAPVAASAGSELRLQADGPMTGRWDELRLEQVLNGLLSNAIKYGAGSPIEVSVGPHGHEAVIEVRDHGPGIEEADIARLFGRFERAMSPRHYAGLGLGLYLIHEIVSAHGGVVTAENAEGGGALFRVRLPLNLETVHPSGSNEEALRN